MDLGYQTNGLFINGVCVFVSGQLASSVITEAWSHYEGRGGRHVTGVHKSVTGAWLHGLLKCTLGHGKVHCNYNTNDQPVREWVTAS